MQFNTDTELRQQILFEKLVHTTANLNIEGQQYWIPYSTFLRYKAHNFFNEDSRFVDANSKVCYSMKYKHYIELYEKYESIFLNFGFDAIFKPCETGEIICFSGISGTLEVMADAERKLNFFYDLYGRIGKYAPKYFMNSTGLFSANFNTTY